MENNKVEFTKRFNVGDVPVLLIRKDITIDKDTGKELVIPNRAKARTLTSDYISNRLLWCGVDGMSVEISTIKMYNTGDFNTGLRMEILSNKDKMYPFFDTAMMMHNNAIMNNNGETLKSFIKGFEDFEKAEKPALLFVLNDVSVCKIIARLNKPTDSRANIVQPEGAKYLGDVYTDDGGSIVYATFESYSELETMITNVDDMKAYIKEHSTAIDYDISCKLIDMHAVKIDGINDLYNSITRSCKKWLADNPKAPEYTLSADMFGLRAWDSYKIEDINARNSFSKYWEAVDKYIDTRETVEGFLLAADSRLADYSMVNMMRNLETIMYGHSSIGETGSRWTYDYITSSAIQLIKPKLVFDLDLDMNSVFSRLEAIGGFVNTYFESEDYETDIYNINSRTASDYVRVLTNNIVQYSVADFCSYLPKVIELKKQLEDKLARHEARKMDFSACTIDNVTNYVEDRLSRIDFLTRLVETLTAYIAFCNVMKESGKEYVSIDDIMDPAYKTKYRIFGGFASGDVELLNMAKPVLMVSLMIHYIDIVDGEDYNTKFNAILKAIATNKNRSIRGSYGKDYERAPQMDINVITECIHAIDDVISKKN